MAPTCWIVDSYWPVRKCRHVEDSPAVCLLGISGFDSEKACCEASFPDGGCGTAPGSQLVATGPCWTVDARWPERTCKQVQSADVCLRGGCDCAAVTPASQMDLLAC